MRILASTALAGVVLLIAAPTTAAAPPTRAERALLSAVNGARSAHGVRPVRFGWPLQDRAHRYAVRLIRTDRFEHASLPPGTRENLAWATANAAGARRIVRMWLASRGHRANLLARGVRRAGVGVAQGEFQGYRNARVFVLRLR